MSDNAGFFAVYRTADGKVLRVGVCEATFENEQAADPGEAVIYLDKQIADPNLVMVVDGKLVAIDE